jgi:hypothetical protein
MYWGYAYELNRNASIAISDLTQVFDVVKNPHWFWLCYSHQAFLRGSVNLEALASLLALWRYCHFKPKIRFLSKLSKMYQFNREFIVDVRRSFRYADWLAKGVIFICGLILVTLSADQLETIWTMGIRDLAYALDGVGFYELGEQIYGLTSDAKGTTLASTCGIVGHDSDKKELESGRLNKKVEALYGPMSLQMANRYSTLGNHYFLNFEDNSASQKCRMNAVRIYRQLDRRVECAQQLSFAAYCQAETGCSDAARKSINEALFMLQTSTPTLRERSGILCELNAAAIDVGDHYFSKFFVESKVIWPLRESGRIAKKKVSPLVASRKIVMFLIVLILLRESLFSITFASWKKKLLATNELEDKLRLLNRLINMELARGDLNAANYYSKELLQQVATS